MSETFTQIIFPPLPKVIREKLIESSVERFDIHNNPIVSSAAESYDNTKPYWFQLYPDRSDFMCKCPGCKTVYCYSSMKPDTNTEETLKTVAALKSFYNQEFEWFCPERHTHDMPDIRTRRRGYDVYEEYAEENWANCVMR